MSYSFDLDGFKKKGPRDYADIFDDEFDYEFSEEYVFEDEFGEEERY